MLVSVDKANECLSFMCASTGDLAGKNVTETVKMSVTQK